MRLRRSDKLAARRPASGWAFPTLAVLILLPACLALLPTSASAVDQIVDFTGGQALPLGSPGTLGFEFSVSSPIAIDGLGFWDEGGNGLLVDHDVGLWNSDGSTLLVSTTVTSSDVSVPSSSPNGTWRFGNVPRRTLPVGNYVVGATAANIETLRASLLPPLSITAISGVSYVEARSTQSGAALEFPVSAFIDGFGPNVRLAPEGFTPTALGPPFQVSTTPYPVGFNSLAAHPDGGFIVAWGNAGSTGSDDSGTSIQARRFSSEAQPLTSEFQVNTFTTSNQLFRSLDLRSDGQFVVVWQSNGSDGTDSSGYSIQAQRFDADGNPLGSQFQVNTYTTDDQVHPSVAVNDSGDFFVVWESDGSLGSDSSAESILGQRFEWTGVPIGAEFQVNSLTTLGQEWPAVTTLPSDAFLVAWGSDNNSIQSQRFDGAGQPAGAEFRVDTSGAFNNLPAIDGHSDGSFVVAWVGLCTVAFDGICGQRFDAGGNPVGQEFQISSSTPASQRGPAISIASDGGFVVSWTDFINSPSIEAQRFDSNADEIGSEFQVSTDGGVYDYAVNSSVAFQTNGNFVVSWREIEGINARRFRLNAVSVPALDPTSAAILVSVIAGVGTASLRRRSGRKP